MTDELTKWRNMIKAKCNIRGINPDTVYTYADCEYVKLDDIKYIPDLLTMISKGWISSGNYDSIRTRIFIFIRRVNTENVQNDANYTRTYIGYSHNYFRHIDEEYAEYLEHINNTDEYVIYELCIFQATGKILIGIVHDSREIDNLSFDYSTLAQYLTEQYGATLVDNISVIFTLGDHFRNDLRKIDNFTRSSVEVFAKRLNTKSCK